MYRHRSYDEQRWTPPVHMKTETRQKKTEQDRTGPRQVRRRRGRGEYFVSI